MTFNKKDVLVFHGANGHFFMIILTKIPNKPRSVFGRHIDKC